MSQNLSTLPLTRRRFFKWLAGLTLGAASTATYSRVLEPRWVDVEQIPLAIPGLPAQLVGKRIAQLSDIHLSQYLSPDRLLSAIDTVNALTPDWLFITGDYVGDDAATAEGLIEPLRRLQMPTFVSFGNHDYWSDIYVVREKLAATPVKMLRNEATQITDGLWFAGVDDLWSGRPDLKAAMRAVPPNVTTLLLAHEPDFFDQVLRADAPIAVQFSGHSHGGQVRLPLLEAGADGLHSYAPILPRYGKRYPIGLRKIGTRQVYTNRGLGVWPVPFRLNCRPEISLFTLQPAL
ncbi:MAG: metallophosphoesterase [Caldilineaceae bacterium]